VDDPARWAAYVRDAPVEEPALLRQLFDLSCAYSGQELSFNKMLGQLQDAGNTTTLSHYLRLLTAAGLVAGLEKYSGVVVRRRGSSPKLQVLNTALVTSRAGAVPGAIRAAPRAWGRLVESAVGAHLVNTATKADLQVSWWREGDHEVDFVLSGAGRVAAFEVKTGFTERAPGLALFRARFRPGIAVVVGPGGIPLDEMLRTSATDWIRATEASGRGSRLPPATSSAPHADAVASLDV